MRWEGLEKLKRLRAMSAPEIAYRLRAKFRSEADHLRYYLRVTDQSEEDLWRFFRGSDVAVLRERLPFGHDSACFKRYLKDGPGRRFYFPTTGEGHERLRKLVESRFPEWKRKAIEEAEHLCHRKIKLLGYGDVELGPEIDWHRDPITGKRWPLRFWADYDLVRDESAGDPKTIHELNRHQHLPRLGKAYFLTGEERYAREAIQQIATWIEQNPPGVGIHWHSSLEISLRTLSWLWTIFFLLPSASFDEATSRRIGASLFAQLGHVYRYPSVFSSPNTHLLGEATALYLAGGLFQELKHANEWRRLGKLLLLREVKRQIPREGIHNELSSYYHCYALDFYLQVLVLAMNNELTWPNQVWQRLAGMMEFLMHLTRPDGTIPLLGDDDGGRALALSKTHYRSFQDALCAGAVLYGRPDFKYVAGEFCEETLWLLGEKAWHIYASMQGSQPCALQAFYPAAGYFIQRSDWGATANHLVFDCGKMGMIRGGHGHADALSIVLFGGGKELLVDPGTSIYNSAPAWRDFFRSSRAHNTATVDYREQSETGGTFSWKQIAQTRLCQQITPSGIEYVEGEHDGYCRLPQGIVHRRGVLHCRPHCWVIVDRFQGEGRHRFDLHYHLSPEAEVSFCEGNEINPEIDLLTRAESACLRLFLCSSALLQAEIISGRNKSIQGWVSRRYGERKPAPTLQVSTEASAPAVVLSLLLPFHSDTKTEIARYDSGTYTIRRIVAEDGAAVACVLESRGHLDLWVAITSDEETKVLGYKMRGEFFWVHSDTKGRKQLFAINAIHFSDDGRPILQNGDSPACALLQWSEDGAAVEQYKEGEEALCAGYAEL